MEGCNGPAPLNIDGTKAASFSHTLTGGFSFIDADCPMLGA
jgi:hypothetical protein